MHLFKVIIRRNPLAGVGMLVCRAGCLLEGVPPQELPPYRTYQAGQELSLNTEDVFIICQGLVECLWQYSLLQGAKRILEILGPGDIYEGGRCEVRALEEVRGCQLGRVEWLKLLRHPSVQERFLSYQHSYWQRQHEWQLVLARGSVRARVAWQLMDLARRFGERDERTGEIFVPIALTQEQQAQLCGSVRSAVWEVLHSFTKKRWLVCGPQGFWVRDEGALQQQSREGL